MNRAMDLGPRDRDGGKEREEMKRLVCVSLFPGLRDEAKRLVCVSLFPALKSFVLFGFHCLTNE
jgi:hypothetical protein